MPYIFTPPTVEEGSPNMPRLFQFYKYDRGITVVRYGTQYIQTRFPTQEYLEAADDYWLCGHANEISNEVAAELTAAGYGDYITEIA